MRSFSFPFQSSDWRIRRWNRQYYGFTQHKSRTIESNSALIQIVWADLSDVYPTAVNIPTTETVSQSLAFLWWYVKNHMWTKGFKRIHWLTLDSMWKINELYIESYAKVFASNTGDHQWDFLRRVMNRIIIYSDYDTSGSISLLCVFFCLLLGENVTFPVVK